MDKKERINLINQIIDRAEAMGLSFDKATLWMDLRNVDEKIGLRLEDFLNGSDASFTHDIYGIQNNFNRDTLEMDNFFLPRYADNK